MAPWTPGPPRMAHSTYRSRRTQPGTQQRRSARMPPGSRGVSPSRRSPGRSPGPSRGLPCSPPPFAGPPAGLPRSSATCLPSLIRSLGDQDEDRVLVPADIDALTRPVGPPLVAGRHRSSDDDLAEGLGGDAVLGLISEISPLDDPPPDPRWHPWQFSRGCECPSALSVSGRYPAPAASSSN